MGESLPFESLQVGYVMAYFWHYFGSKVPQRIVCYCRIASSRTSECMINEKRMAAYTMTGKMWGCPAIPQAKTSLNAPLWRVKPCSSIGSTESQEEAPFSEPNSIAHWRCSGNLGCSSATAWRCCCCLRCRTSNFIVIWSHIPSISIGYLLLFSEDTCNNRSSHLFWCSKCTMSCTD